MARYREQNLLARTFSPRHNSQKRSTVLISRPPKTRFEWHGSTNPHLFPKSIDNTRIPLTRQPQFWFTLFAMVRVLERAVIAQQGVSLVRGQTACCVLSVTGGEWS